MARRSPYPPPSPTAPAWLALLAWLAAAPLACQTAEEPGFSVMPSDDDDGGADDDDSAGPGAAPVSAVHAELDAQVLTMPVVQWTQDEDADGAWLEYRFAGEDPLASPPLPAPAGDHTQVLLGVPPQTEVLFRVINEIDGVRREGGDEHTITTGALPADLPTPTMLSWDEARTSPERWLLASLEVQTDDWYQGPWWLFVIDRRGRVVWYLPIADDRCTMHARVALSGDHLLFEETTIYQGDHGAGSRLRRLTLDRGHDEVIPVDGLGSTFAEGPDGILFDSYTEWPRTWLEELGDDGTRRPIWDCAVWAGAYDLGVWGCDPNETVWVETTDTVLWSMWSSDTVVELDRQTGELLRQFGPLPDSWSFDPPEAGFEMQHYPHYTADGTLLLTTWVPGEQRQQRAREYLLDEDTETLVEVWSYGEGVDLFARYAGAATRFPNGNTLVNYGTHADLREIDPDGALLWEIRWDDSYLIGHATAFDDLYAISGAR